MQKMGPFSEVTDSGCETIDIVVKVRKINVGQDDEDIALVFHAGTESVDRLICHVDNKILTIDGVKFRVEAYWNKLRLIPLDASPIGHHVWMPALRGDMSHGSRSAIRAKALMTDRQKITLVKISTKRDWL